MRSARAVALVGGVMLLAVLAILVTGVGTWSEHRAAGIHRYRFERASRGSVAERIRAEIAFHQARAARDPHGGLDLAALAGAYLRMARATGDLGWYLQAEQAATRSLANLPVHNPGALLVLARIAEARHDFPEALRLAGLAGREEGLAIAVTASLAMGRVAEARTTADILVSRAPGTVSHGLRALVREAEGRDADATRDFERALAREEAGEAGASAWARTMLGRLHARAGRLREARALYDEALRVLPEYPLALLNLADVEIRERRYAAAERHFSRVVTIGGTSPNVFDHAVLRGFARVNALRGDASHAQAMCEDAERRLRRDVVAGAFGHRRELAQLLLERGRTQDTAEAIALMREETRVRADAETLALLARALMRAGHLSEARDAIREALRWGVRDAVMLHRAATIEQALGNHAEAARYAELARDVDPTVDAHVRMLAEARR